MFCSISPLNIIRKQHQIKSNHAHDFSFYIAKVALKNVFLRMTMTVVSLDFPSQKPWKFILITLSIKYHLETTSKLNISPTHELWIVKVPMKRDSIEHKWLFSRHTKDLSNNNNNICFCILCILICVFFVLWKIC